jgi:hypothetical protein
MIDSWLLHVWESLELYVALIQTFLDWKRDAIRRMSFGLEKNPPGLKAQLKCDT